MHSWIAATIAAKENRNKKTQQRHDCWPLLYEPLQRNTEDKIKLMMQSETLLAECQDQSDINYNSPCYPRPTHRTLGHSSRALYTAY